MAWRGSSAAGQAQTTRETRSVHTNAPKEGTSTAKNVKKKVQKPLDKLGKKLTKKGKKG
jgi:hypothetical protein